MASRQALAMLRRVSMLCRSAPLHALPNGSRARWGSFRCRPMLQIASRLYSVPPKVGLDAFDGAGIDVTRKFVENDKIIDQVQWYRKKEYDDLASELVELHNQLIDLKLLVQQHGHDAPQELGRVKHLGHNVFVQFNTIPIDVDSREGSPVTITRRESRAVVSHALDALKSRVRVAVTGQPGIGKTRGSMMYALQTLLHQKAAVLYVDNKSRKMILFLPGEDGHYRVWSARASKFDDSNLQSENRLVALIDPPEEGFYSSGGECRVLKFVSNNAEKHFRNWKKDGVLLVTSMPSAEEVLAMTEVLWDDKLNAVEDIPAEQRKEVVRKRIALVGPVPRHVFAKQEFDDAVKEYLRGSFKAAAGVNNSDLYKALRGTYSPSLETHDATAPSKVFFMTLDLPLNATLTMRQSSDPVFQLTPIAAVVLLDRLQERAASLTERNFEDFAFDWLCAKLRRKRELQAAGDSIKEAFARIDSLSDVEKVVYRPRASNFPFVDFVASRTNWYNAKSKAKGGGKVEIALHGALIFFQHLDLVKQTCDRVILTEKGKGFSAKLTLLSNDEREGYWLKPADPEKYGSPDFQKDVFHKLVTVHRVENISDLTNDVDFAKVFETREELEKLGYLS